MSWHEMQTVNDRKCPWAWSRPKALLNIALAVLFTSGAILVDFMFRRGRRTAASDCKAYSLAKYAGAQELGISADRVRLVVVHNSRHAEDHKVGRRLEDVSFAVGQPKPPVGCNYG
jgi:hypothetical protein